MSSSSWLFSSLVTVAICLPAFLSVSAAETDQKNSADAPSDSSSETNSVPRPESTGTQGEPGVVLETETQAASVPDETPSPAPPVVTPSTVEKKANPGGFSGLFRRMFKWMDDDAEKAGSEPPETDESQAGTPDLLTPEGDLGGKPEDFLTEAYRSASREWEAPNYANQNFALGWSPDVFSVPRGLRKRVDFWKAIYSKYTTDQGLLHDSVHLEVVYEAIDFSQIMKKTELTSRQKAREREKLVDARRDQYEERLLRLAKVTDPGSLSGEDLRVWKMFENVKEPNKFEVAAKKNRVRFQLGQKDKFVVGIYYSGRYLHEMERIFRDAGLPIELTRLPFVESSFNIFARSKVGASGIWQFMRRTARPYMMVNNNVDERNDPLEATRASAKMLKANYQMLQSWPLAVTGYNHGPSGVARIVKKTGTNDLAEIVNMYSSRTFGFASENFYACFLAALEVERHARKYFGDVKWSTEFEGVELPLTRPLPHKALLVWYSGDENLTRLHNFHLKTPVLKGKSMIPKGTFIRVPKAMRENALAFMNGSIGTSGAMKLLGTGGEKDFPLRATSPESVAAAKSISAGLDADTSGARRYRVRSGDNLSNIARSHGVSLNDLKKANGIGSTGKIRRGQWLTIPD